MTNGIILGVIFIVSAICVPLLLFFFIAGTIRKSKTMVKIGLVILVAFLLISFILNFFINKTIF